MCLQNEISECLLRARWWRMKNAMKNAYKIYGVLL